MANLERRMLALAAVVASGLGLSACAPVEEEDPAAGLDEPAVVEAIEGSDGLHQVVLTEQAAERLDLTTAAVEKSSGGAGAAVSVVPYGAVIYDPGGDTWAYTETEPLSYVRDAIDVARIDGGVAVLRSGPDPGTQVVTVGAAELYGAEVGVDH